MKRVGVVGAGTMGIGVSEVFAARAYDVVLVDVADRALERARSEIARNARMMPLLRPGIPHPEPDEVVGRVRFTTDLTELKTAGYVVENVTERWETKRDLYPRLDELCPDGVVFGVNTSAIPITRVAALTHRPGAVVGTHFMNPAPLKPTVEVIRGFHTSDDTVARTTGLLASAGKDAVVVRDSPGFVTNRVMMLTVNEAVFLLHEGVATAGDIDRLFRECFGHSMGPLATADLIGLDTVLLSLEVLYDNLNEPKYRPCTLLRQMVDAGLLGRKTGRGFHPYETTT
ncbi:MAG TPA: 3-hydroxyacyl-CoA dehydrogenase NAD-binding domain-containing protein [Streptosporangiaceae bacterium]|jgi:3-hydroxybutyryl-CoA dehydrogenase